MNTIDEHQEKFCNLNKLGICAFPNNISSQNIKATVYCIYSLTTMYISLKAYQILNIRPFNKGRYEVPLTPKWSFVPSDFYECCIRYS